MRQNLDAVCLAISSFRNDEEVLMLLRAVCAAGPHPFHRVLIVDSLGSGRIANAIADEGWERVDYHNFDRNLGSAGNLAQRMSLAAQTGAAYLYALNHDGRLVLPVIRRLLEIAQADPRLGAVYPMLRQSSRGGAYNLTYRGRFPIIARMSRHRPKGDLMPVWWGSSNGALYNLASVREGLLPYADLFHAWEDLGYGWILHRAGWHQVAAVAAQLEDNYEYQRVSSIGWIANKPAWYSYYYSRNLWLLAGRTKQPPHIRMIVGARILAEFLVCALLRDHRVDRLRYLACGLTDALASRTGKWRLP